MREGRNGREREREREREGGGEGEIKGLRHVKARPRELSQISIYSVTTSHDLA